MGFIIIILGVLLFLVFKRVERLDDELDKLKKHVYSENNIPIKETIYEEEINTEQKIVIQEEVISEKNEVYPAPVVEGEYNPPEFNFINKIVSKVKSYFTEGNILVRIGGVVLFIGMGFLLKYVSEHSTITIETKLIASSIFSLIIVFIGWKLKERKDQYGLILQGIGISLGYLIIFMAAKIFNVVPMETAFILMSIYVLFGSLLAIKQNSYPLALFAITGGFVSPIILSDGSGNYITLFSYYVLLDLGVFFISLYKSWRSLNLVGFVFTFIVATFWGVLNYSPELFNSVEPFLITFFSIYLAIAVITAIKGRFDIKGYVDSTLVFGLPLVAFPLQLELVRNFEYGAGISAVILGIVYSLLSFFLKNKKDLNILSYSFLFIGILFFTISIPYFFDEKLTGAIWAMESVGILWSAFKQNKIYSRYFGELLLIIGSLKYLFATTIMEVFKSHDPITLIETPFMFNTIYLGYLIVSTSIFLSAYILYKNEAKNSEKILSGFLIVFASIIFTVGGAKELLKIDILIYQTMLIYITSFSLLLSYKANKFNWDTLKKLLQFYPFVGGFLILIISQTSTHIFEGWGALSLITFFGLNYYFLSIYDKYWINIKKMHILSYLFFIGVLISELLYWVKLTLPTYTLYYTISIIIPILFVAVLTMKNIIPYGFKKYSELYKYNGILILNLIMGISVLFFTLLDGNPIPLNYLPIINPLGILTISIIGFISYWTYQYKDKFEEALYRYIPAVGLFIFLTTEYARSIHFYTDVPYGLVNLISDNVFQTGLSILWSVMAIIIMLVAKKYNNRIVWMTGFGLLILVVIKLFFFELSQSGSIERIVSFMVVGILLLLIGYLAPIPPKKEYEIENK